MFQPDLTQVEYTFPPASLASVSQVLRLAAGTCNLTVGGLTTDGSQTYDTTHPCTWQRFGNVVRITGFLTVTAVSSSPTGNPVFRGLPFAPASTGAAGRGFIARNTGVLASTLASAFQFQGQTVILLGTPTGGISPTMTAGSLWFNLEYLI